MLKLSNNYIQLYSDTKTYYINTQFLYDSNYINLYYNKYWEQPDKAETKFEESKENFANLKYDYTKISLFNYSYNTDMIVIALAMIIISSMAMLINASAVVLRLKNGSIINATVNSSNESDKKTDILQNDNITQNSNNEEVNTTSEKLTWAELNEENKQVMLSSTIESMYITQLEDEDKLKELTREQIA